MNDVAPRIPLHRSLCWVALASAACAVDPAAPETLPDGSRLPISYLMEPLPDIDAGDVELHRLIGRLSVAGACPSVGVDWSGAPLFAAGAPGLDVYCRYDWIGAAPPIAADLTAALAYATPTFDLAPDRPVVAPMAPALRDVWETSARSATRAHAGDILTMQGSPPRKVKVAIVDNLPTLPPGSAPWSSPLGGHGRELAAIVRDLSCDNAGRCAVHVGTRQAMSLQAGPGVGEIVDLNTDPGDFGSLSALAAAIREEVAAWEADGTYDELVLNLSLAWHPAFGGADDPAERPDTAAVHAALVDAQCRGALIIAAAGNTAGGSELDEGPLLPAAWATLTTTDSDCLAATGQPAAYPDAPLLYAASGVDHWKKDIDTARPGSRSPWAAYADTFSLATATSPMAARTGTSLSTAVVSTAAASVLAWRPNLTPHAAMTALHTSGVHVGTAASWFTDAGLPSSARQVRVCQALASACQSNPGPTGCTSATQPSCSTLNPHLSASATARAAWIAAAGAGLYVPVPVPDGGVCPGALARHSPAPEPDLACPEVQLYDDGATVPFTDPQPEDGHCPTCTVEIAAGKLLLESPIAFNLHSDRSIKVFRSDGSSTTYAIPPLGPVTTFVYTLPSGALNNVGQATWTSTVGATTRTNAMIILP
jgi:hypothetical protein